MNWGRNSLLVVVAAYLSALAVPPAAGQSAPPPIAPATTAPDTVRLGPATRAESLLVTPLTGGDRWSLARCIETALKANADVRVAEARLKQASGSALSAWSGIIPSLSVGAGYTYSIPDKNQQSRRAEFGDSTVLGFANKDQFSSIDASLTSNIFSAPAIKEKQRRDHLRSSSTLDQVETRNQVVFFVKQQYFVLLKAERLAQVAHETERLARDEETRADALFQVGTVARGDVLKARARRATTEGERLQADTQVQIQAAALRGILGLDPSQPIAPEQILDEPFVIPDSAASIRQALIARPLLESAKAVERAAHSGLTGAHGERLPTIAGSIDYSRSRSQSTLEDITGFPNAPSEIDVESYSTEWRGNVRASIPIFEGLAIEGNVRQAKGALLEAESQRRQREIDVAVEVQQAWLTLRTSIQRIDVAREGLVSAEEDHKFSKGRYELGAGTYLDLLTAELSLATARQRLIEAVADAKIAEAGLEFAIGAKRY